MSETSGWKFRLAEPADAEAFAKWVATNQQIDPKDVTAASKEKNPTVVYFAAENPEGVVVAFAPVYAQMTLAHLGFNPDASGKEKLKALEVLLDGAMAFAVQFGVREITTVSREGYGVAQWAMKHDFELESRQLFKLDVNKVIERLREAEEPCAPIAVK